MDFEDAVQAVCRRFWDAIFMKITFLQIHFCVFGGVLEAPRERFGKVWARFGAISVRSGPHFGAGPS